MLTLPPTESRKRRRGAKGRAATKSSNSTPTNNPIIDHASPAVAVAPKSTPASAALQNPSPLVLQKSPFTVHHHDTVSTTTNKKRKRRQSVVPKEGEPGFLTKTQLRNARKRRSKQRQQHKAVVISETVEAEGEVSKAKKKKKGSNQKNKKKSVPKKESKNADPSLRYIQDPTCAPLVKKAKSFFAQQQISFPIFLGKVRGWRTVSKLPVRWANPDKTSCVIGLFQPGSHSIVQVSEYPAHHSSINRAIDFLQKQCDKLGIPPFDEMEGTGLLRYVCINVERSTGKIQLTLVWNSEPYHTAKEQQNMKEKELQEKFCQHIVSMAGEIQLHSLWVHYNHQWKHADNIFDYGTSGGSSPNELWKHVYGPKHIQEVLSFPPSPSCEIQRQEKVVLFFPPNVFRQANLDAFAKIIGKIRMYIQNYTKSRSSPNPLPSCVELYGGVGTIGLNLCDLVSELVCSDENPHNKACFEKTVGMLSLKTQKKCRYISKNASNVIREDGDVLLSTTKCEILVVDPPRKGLEEFVTRSIIDAAAKGNGPKVLVYVSCGFDAFVRDCDLLVKSGQWSLQEAEGHILFPGADAIETLAFFTSTRN